MNVAVLGASHKPERYANKAIKKLMENGHQVYPIHPALKSVYDLDVFPSIKDIPDPIHTLTLYVNAERSTYMQDEIFNLKPERVIFNPGTENKELKAELEKQGVKTLEACTLVMLDTKQF